MSHVKSSMSYLCVGVDWIKTSVVWGRKQCYSMWWHCLRAVTE